MRLKADWSKVQSLREQFVSLLGYEFFDSGRANIGYKENGEMVCVDFGDCSFDDPF